MDAHAFDHRPRNEDAIPQCQGWADASLDNMGLRIASVFIILTSSLLGVFLPMAFARTAASWAPASIVVFISKHFGTGVILATAFLHLLSPAVEALSDDCLSGYLPHFDWGHLICLLAVLAMFFIELLVSRYSFFPPQETVFLESNHGQALETQHQSPYERTSGNGGTGIKAVGARDLEANTSELFVPTGASGVPNVASRTAAAVVSSPCCRTAPGVATSIPSLSSLPNDQNPRLEAFSSAPYSVNDKAAHPAGSSRLLSLLILEFGILFHSVFIGLSLAGSSNLVALLIALSFHQFFEGIGLGSRLAAARWPPRWLRYTGALMALGFALATPLGTAVGLAVNERLKANSAVSQLVNGVIDAASSGIVLYTVLVELIARDFITSREMQDAKLKVSMLAFAALAVGAGAMALLAKWI